MDLLSEEQLAEVRLFFEGTGKTFFDHLTAGIVSAWMAETDAAAREHLWQRLQAVQHLEAAIRDSHAVNEMNRRMKERQSSVRA